MITAFGSALLVKNFDRLKMKFIGNLISEVSAWLQGAIRWLPGKVGVKIRFMYYRCALASCGNDVHIAEGGHLRDCRHIHMGSNINLGIMSQLYASGTGREIIVIKNNVSMNSNVMINADFEGFIEIGDNCIIGPNVVIRTSNHEFGSKNELIKDQGHRPGRIVIQRNTWVGANCTIIGNVNIGEGAVIGAGSVVNKDIDHFAIAAGIPARAIGKR